MKRPPVWLAVVVITCLGFAGALVEAQGRDNTRPPGFIALFNGRDLSGWQALLELPGLRSGAGLDPAEPGKLSPEERAAKQREADAKYLPHWTVRDGVLHYDSKGQNLRSVKDYGDVELLVDWRIPAKADTGVYLRGTPQIQIWDRPGVGSGGLFNNKTGARNPLKAADRPIGEWNTFRILIEGDVTTVWLNGELVVDKVVYENYWDRNKPLPATGPIELQHHGNPIEFKNIYVKELAPVADAAFSPQAGDVRLLGKTKYLNNARAVVTHTIDDSTRHVPAVIDAMDKYGVKGTLFISTEQDPPVEERFFTQLQVWSLWPRLARAIENGHEIGSHARTHPCRRPDTAEYCAAAYTEEEVAGSRDDILRRTNQPYVWSWGYPCGHCANHEFIRKRIAAAGYIVARNYPDEPTNGHLVPDLRTWAPDFYNAAYTQVVQKRGGSATSQITDVTVLNTRFDEVYAEGNIYHFLSHPQWLDFGPEGFYERHLAHIARRSNVWYVPMGPLYAYRALADQTQVSAAPASGGARAVFSVTTALDTRIYNGSITLEFQAPAGTTVASSGRKLADRPAGPTDRWTGEYVRRDGQRLYVTVKPNTTLEFR